MNKKFIILFFILLAVITGCYFFRCFSCFHEYKRLPNLTGTYAVGTIQYPLIDTSRKDPHAPDSQRELLLQIFYPANQRDGKQASYMHNILSTVKADLKKAKKDITDKDLLFLDSLKTNALQNIAVSGTEQIYPVILFSPGFGMPVGGYTAILEDLASHGYIVVGINYPYITSPVHFPDGRIIFPLDIMRLSAQEKTDFKKRELATWIDDVIFVFDQLSHINDDETSVLYHHLDTTNIGILGHSFGAQIVDQVCRKDSRCKAGVNIEGKIAPENATLDLSVPFLFLMAPHNNPDDIYIEQLWSIIKKHAPAYYIIMEGADHGTFTDLNYLLPRWFTTTIDPLRGITITRAILADFFDMYLKYKSSVLLKAELIQYPELILKK